MAKILITADWHFGYPGRLDDLVYCFKSTIKYCVNHDIDKIFMLGDLCHNREYITHDVSSALVSLFEEMQENNIEMLTFPGNHDMYLRYSWKINPLKQFSKYITVCDDIGMVELENRKAWIVPCIEYEPTYMKVINKLADKFSPNDILLTHIGVNKAQYNVCFLLTVWNLIDLSGLPLLNVFTGHFHCHQEIGKVVYPGSPIAFRFDEGFVDHGVIVFDDSDGTYEFIDVYDICEKPPIEFISTPLDNGKIPEDILKHVKNNNIRIILSEGDDEGAVREELNKIGVNKIVIVKPKDDKISAVDVKYDDSKFDLFAKYVEHDNPVGLDKPLLLAIDADIRSQVKVEDEDDIN